MYNLYETTNHTKIDLIGEHMDAIVISNSPEHIKEDLESVDLSWANGVVTAITDDEIIESVFEKIHQVLADTIDDYDEDSHIFFVEKMIIGQSAYLNIMFIDNMNHEVQRILRNANIRFFPYGECNGKTAYQQLQSYCAYLAIG